MAARGWGTGTGMGSTPEGRKVSFWSGEHILELDCSDNCTTLSLLDVINGLCILL